MSEVVLKAEDFRALQARVASLEKINLTLVTFTGKLMSYIDEKWDLDLPISLINEGLELGFLNHGSVAPPEIAERVIKSLKERGVLPDSTENGNG